MFRQEALIKKVYLDPVQHPSLFIPAELTDQLRSLSAEAEKLGALHPGQLEIIYQQKWFNLFVPRNYGGLELSLPEALRIEEALAWTDGSIGWTVTLCSGAAWFIGFLPPSAARELFSDPKACLAGSGQAAGIAEVRGDGYQVTGHWKHATGAPHATIFTANCVLYKDGEPLKDSNGDSVVRAFWFHRHEVQVQQSWYSIGMVATASQSFGVQDLAVPANRCFTIDPRQAVVPLPVFRYPFMPFAEATLAVNSAGMATRFLDLCRPSRTLDKASRIMEEERVSFYRIVDASWAELLKTGSLSDTTAVAVSRASHGLAALSLQWVDKLYPLCGLEAADARTEINRVWRNLHTASQHILLRSADE